MTALHHENPGLVTHEMTTVTNTLESPMDAAVGRSISESSTGVADAGGAAPGMGPEGSGRLERALPRGVQGIVHATPVMKRSIELRTDKGQRVYRRAFDRLRADLYVLTVRTRVMGHDDAARAIEAIISEAFEHVTRDLKADLERTEVLIDSVKLDEYADYPLALREQARFSTPRARQYLLLIEQMDELLVRYDALWLHGIIETPVHVQRSQAWQQRLLKVANRLRELANRTRVTLARQPNGRIAPAAMQILKDDITGTDSPTVDSSVFDAEQGVRVITAADATGQASRADDDLDVPSHEEPGYTEEALAQEDAASVALAADKGAHQRARAS